MRSRVLITTCNTGWVHKLVVLSLMRLLGDQRCHTRLILPTWTPYENGLNRVAKDIITGAEPCDFWLNVDSDNPPLKNPLDLVELDCDLIGLPTPIWHNTGNGEWPICINGMDRVPDGFREHADKSGLQEVDAIGSGCFLMHRRCLSMVEPPWFVRETDSYGIVNVGPDFGFCDRLKAAGGRIFCHYDYPCRHFNSLDILEVMEVINDLRTPSPSTAAVH